MNEDEIHLVSNEDIWKHRMGEGAQHIISKMLGEVNIGKHTTSSNKALLMFAMDNSGSMGMWERYMCHCVFSWTKMMLQRTYNDVEIFLIGHSTEAKIYLTEESLFGYGNSGGTICSAPYRLAKSEIARYPDHDIYFFHGTDGDNLTSDCTRSLKLLDEILECVHFVGIVEPNQYDRYSTMRQMVFRNISHPKFHHSTIRERKDIHALLHNFYGNMRTLPQINKDGLFLLKRDE